MSCRLQLALNVNDIGEAVAFYSKLFGTDAAKVREGYANFAIAEPPLKLVLLENPDTGAVEAEQAPLAEAGLASGTAGGDHLLLRQAGQVLGAGRSGR